MKKTLAAAILASMTLAVAAPAFAAANPFVDVPANHWAYGAVNKLVAAHITDGYGDGTFRGDKTITRYEMAVIVAKAFTKYDTAKPADRVILDRLAREFGGELKNLGVRVAALEKNQPKIKIGGETRLRYRYADVDDAAIASNKAFDNRQRLHLNAQVNDKISYTGRLEASSTLGDGVSSGVAFNRSFITVKDFLGLDSVLVGRQGAYAGKLLNVSSSSNNDGLVLNKKIGAIKLSGFVFEENLTPAVAAVPIVPVVPAVPATSDQFKGIYADINVGKNADLSVGYTKSGINDAKSLDVGASAQLGKLSLVGDYVDTDGTVDAQAWAVQLSVGVKRTTLLTTGDLVDKTKPHTSGLGVGYRNVETGALAGNGKYSAFYGSTNKKTQDADNVKGMLVEYQNVVAKNTIFTIEYQDLKQESSGNDLDKTVSAHVQLWF